MIDAEDFCARLAARGFTHGTGVPCSYFSGPIELLSREGRYLPAANEGAALAIAAGAALAGRRTAVLAQNSGLGNMVNPLTSLSLVYDIPVLVFASLRGWPDPARDEPQHAVMGPATTRLLDGLGVAWSLLDEDPTRFPDVLDAAEEELRRGRPAFVLVRRNAVGGVARPPAGPASGPTRADVLRALVPELRGAAVVSTTGYTSRELFAVRDDENHFYMQGSMGHAAALGLGVALGLPSRPVVVLDGDGAALMHLGTLSTIGAAAPANLVHVVFDNGAYESTGFQATTSGTTDFVHIGLSSGYRTAREATDPDDAAALLRGMLAAEGPHLLVVRVSPATGSAPPRATAAVSAPLLHHRFRTALTGVAPGCG
ncbi:phosphonopyruvate decarboxylase [Actinosynnema sp. NPDC020468]|uniref:phosphonopyruvate decarboxylase n=1 Tax=Actinosynnema sp. NPDC020468 TaxID=3154488 RepID=UPI0033C5CCA8